LSKYSIKNFKYLPINSDSPTSTTQGPISFQSGLVTIVSLQNWCSFDPGCKHTHTNERLVFHMILFTVEGI